MKQLIFLNGKKYDISGQDGNAFAVLGTVASYLKQCNIPKDEIDAFREEAMSDDYDHLIATCAAATGIEFLKGKEDSDWVN